MKRQHLIHKINTSSGALETYDIATGELVLTNGIAISHGYVYSERMGEAICEMLARGSSLSAISQLDNMPSIATMAKWSKLYPAFSQQMKAARAARAEIYRDKAEQILEATETRDDVAVNKFKFEGYMKLASTDAPDIYGGGSQAGQALPNLKLVINTGIVRGDIEAIQGVEYEEVAEGSSRIAIRADGHGGSGAGDGGDSDGAGATSGEAQDNPSQEGDEPQEEQPRECEF